MLCDADNHLQKSASNPNAKHNGSTIHEVEGTSDTEDRLENGDRQPPQQNGAMPTHHQLLHRPQYINRASTEGFGSPNGSTAKNLKDPKPVPQHSPGRRNSWMSSLSSKFSSGSNPPTGHPGPVSPTASKLAQNTQAEQPNLSGVPMTPGAKDVKRSETSTPPGSQSPKSGHPSFLQSALRRLSYNNPANLAKAVGSGGLCPRKTLNLDPHRERCGIPEFAPAKLRRVAFCVDVEIAAPAKYTDADEEEPPLPPPPPGRRPSLNQLENQIEIKKRKDKKLKMSEGAALKNPQAVVEEKDTDGVVEPSGEYLGSGAVLALDNAAQTATKETTRKKEKKKRSEEERKDRKERRLSEALANGTVPAELKQEGSSCGTTDSSSGTHTPQKSQDRPTTDPLRIYRRCCQLRETPILKRITEQISSPSACHAATPGIISCLDLSGFWMELPDVITLSDYLAVVPVKKLILEDCGLTDEGVRVILAGLIAAKTPEQAKYNKRLAKKCKGQSTTKVEQSGVIEKLSLKNNPKIGREGWCHIGLFIYMSKSLKALDLSMIPCVPSVPPSTGAQNGQKQPADIPTLLRKAVTERLGGSQLEELVLAECGLDTDHIGKVVDGVIQCGLTRLGLASNNLTHEGFQHVLRFVKTGKCEGLDLGGNDLREDLSMLADCLDNKNVLYALSLADCNLSPSSLVTLFPALVRLPNFRFIDLSHNRGLFTTRPNALGLFRKYLPQFPVIKRIHLLDVAMSPEHAIALAEILPENKSLAHVNILENHLLTPLASAKDEASQEEACALYASLMAAVRVSKTIICLDIDVPSQDSSEVVKALAKQVVAYSLRNLERIPVTEANGVEAGPLVESNGGEKPVTVPDVLLHIVGNVDGYSESLTEDEPAPDDDYIVGGTGVVKALGVCLNRAADLRKGPRDMSPSDSGSLTPRKSAQGDATVKGKAKEMSKNLLDSARKIRARLQPALVREARAGDEMSYSKFNPVKPVTPVTRANNHSSGRLQFLDTTLERMILRFEDEYPETRIRPPNTTYEYFSDPNSTPSSLDHTSVIATVKPDRKLSNSEPFYLDDSEAEAEADEAIKAPISRRSSDISLASRQAQEEGRMHRFGQRMRRDLLRPQTLDYAHGTTGEEPEAEHLQLLRKRLENLGGDEIQESIHRLGPEAMYDAVGATAEELAQLERESPEALRYFKDLTVAPSLGHTGSSPPSRAPPPPPHGMNGTSS